MAKKIILILSELRPGAGEQTYLCPDGSEVVGCQTNEAPVRYLLRAYPDTAEIICIVTPEAEKTAWSSFPAARDSAVMVTTAFFSRRRMENWPYLPSARKELCCPRQKR